MGGSSSTPEMTSRDLVWERMCETWFHICSDKAFKPGKVIQFLSKEDWSLRYGEVDRILNCGAACVKIAEGVFMVLKKEQVIWAYVADEYLEGAKIIISAAADINRIAALTSIEGVKLVVTASAAHGLFGASSVTSGLATLGGGSVAAGGAGIVGGIVVVAAAPSVLSARAIYNLCNALENNSATPTAVAIGSAGGAVAASTLGVVMVAESGAVVGFSASGITSGLAALGGGSVASGGAGMLGGVAVVASGAALAAAAVGGTVWLVAHQVVQGELRKQRSKMLDMAVKEGFKNLLG